MNFLDQYDDAFARSPLPMSDDLAAGLGLIQSVFPRLNDPSITDVERSRYLGQYMLPRIRLEIMEQQEIIFSRFTAFYILKLLEKWRAADDPNSPYFTMLNHIVDNPYFHIFFSSDHPASKGITLLHAQRLDKVAWNSVDDEDGVFHGCQFLATMLILEESEQVLPQPLVDRLVVKIRNWERVFASIPDMDPLPRAIGLLRRQPSWLRDGKQVRGEMERKLRACNLPGCRVPYVPGNDTLQQCSRCKTARYCSQDHQRQHWVPHKQLCHRPVWV
ncbi:hypothetical protein JAAARDRAFT_203033 [Jaapia argillacea MUCL 33604]|uniref:MYND-type domain-containing protein n=1 Tax=Jaapia argillacea MUCL 33604 TaxID=933084 RepID=A0A067QBS0_9AGAM|nr:hypothetical protein JAAARDRAFT_203033 [Jaapia argillacea MUCL 33604]